jgi:hypothetical protein
MLILIPVKLTLLCLLLLPCALRAAPPAQIYYFDNDYRVRPGLAAAVERLAASSGTARLERASSALTYTDGARFVLSDSSGLLPQDLASAAFEFEYRVELVRAPGSLLLVPRGFERALDPLGLEALAASLGAETVPAEVLAGRTTGGKKFSALYLPYETPGQVWFPTIRMEHRMTAGGARGSFVTLALPQGMDSPTERAVTEAADKDVAALLSIGTGGRSGEENGPAALLPMLHYLEDAGTDVAALGPRDLRNLWLLHSSGAVKPGEGAVPVLSNAVSGDNAFAGLLRPYAVRVLSERKVAFICLVPAGPEERYALAGTPLSLWDPRAEEVLQSFLADLRAREAPDAVVAVSFFRKHESGWLASVPGIDVVIEKHWEGAVPALSRVELSPDGQRSGGALLVVRPDHSGAGRLQLEFGRRGLTVAENISGPGDGPVFGAERRAAMKEQALLPALGSGDGLLPDPRRMSIGGGEPMPFYSIPDFYSMAAGLLRRRHAAEAAVLRITPNGTSVLGDTPSSLVRAWLGPDEPLETALVPGSLLRTFLRGSPPSLSPQARYSVRAFQGREYYAVSGVDRSGRVGGLPLRDAEHYLVTAPAALLQGRPGVQRRQPAGQLHEAVLAELRALKTAAKDRTAWEDAVRAAAEDRPAERPIWRINLRSLSLQASNSGVKTPPGYASVNESRLSAPDQTRIQGSCRLFSEYYRGRFRLDSGVSADYGKVVLRPDNSPRVTAESVDQLVLESELRYRLRSYNGALGALVIGPFASAAFDTEFSRNTPAPLRKVVRARAGLKMFEGASLQELYAGATTEQVYTYSPARTKFAAETGFRLAWPLPGTALTLNADGNYRLFARSRFDTARDLRDRLELNARLSARLYGDITINPFASYLRASGKKLAGSASNLNTGFSLEYTRLFKLRR